MQNASPGVFALASSRFANQLQTAFSTKGGDALVTAFYRQVLPVISELASKREQTVVGLLLEMTDLVERFLIADRNQSSDVLNYFLEVLIKNEEKIQEVVDKKRKINRQRADLANVALKAYARIHFGFAYSVYRLYGGMTLNTLQKLSDPAVFIADFLLMDVITEGVAQFELRALANQLEELERAESQAGSGAIEVPGLGDAENEEAALDGSRTSRIVESTENDRDSMSHDATPKRFKGLMSVIEMSKIPSDTPFFFEASDGAYEVRFGPKVAQIDSRHKERHFLNLLLSAMGNGVIRGGIYNGIKPLFGIGQGIIEVRRYMRSHRRLIGCMKGRVLLILDLQHMPNGGYNKYIDSELCEDFLESQDGGS